MIGRRLPSGSVIACDRRVTRLFEVRQHLDHERQLQLPRDPVDQPAAQGGRRTCSRRSTTSRRSVYGEPVAQPHPSLWMLDGEGRPAAVGTLLREAPRSRRCRPSRASFRPSRASAPHVSRYAWSIRLRPTSPLVLGRPGGQHQPRRSRSRWRRARTRGPGLFRVVCSGDAGFSYALNSMWLTRPRVRIDGDLGRHGLGHEVDAAGCQRLRQRLARVVLGLDRADGNAVDVALTALALLDLMSADRADRHVSLAVVVVGVRHAVSGLRRCCERSAYSARRARSTSHTVELSGDHLIEIGQRHLPHRVDVARARTSRPGTPGLRRRPTRRAHLRLSGSRARVPGSRQRPVQTLAEPRAHLEVLGQHPQAPCPPSASSCRRRPSRMSLSSATGPFCTR